VDDGFGHGLDYSRSNGSVIEEVELAADAAHTDQAGYEAVTITDNCGRIS
jgi:hypothetical protein